MVIEDLLRNANPDIVVFLMTAFIGFLSWLIKGLIENPLKESKITFNRIFEKRLEILTEIKTRLVFLAYFPVGKESLEYKQQLQDLFLKDGLTAYLNRSIYDNVIKISVDPNTNEQLLAETLIDINNELSIKIDKVHDETSFYRKFSNYNPLRRIVGFTYLSFLYLGSFLVILGVLYMSASALLSTNYLTITIIVIALILLMFFVDRWLKKD